MNSAASSAKSAKSKPVISVRNALASGLLLLVVHGGLAGAAGLGRIRVLSQYGQPFHAEIDLHNVTREELATLNATLAPPSAYVASNLRFDHSLNSMRLTLERRADGSRFVRATTTRRVYEPYVDVLVDLTWQGGKFQRHYAALLDLPPGGEAAAASAEAKPVAAAPERVARSATASDQQSGEPAERPARARRTRQQPAATESAVTAPAPAKPAPPSTTGAAPTSAANAAASPTVPSVTSPVAKPTGESSAPAKSDLAKADASLPKSGSADTASPATTTTAASASSASETAQPPRSDAVAPQPPREATSTPPGAPDSRPTLPADKKSATAEAARSAGFWVGLQRLIWPIVGAILALLAALIGFLLWRRRQENIAANEEVDAVDAVEPSYAAPVAAGAVADADKEDASRVDAATPRIVVATPQKITVANAGEVTDPLDEAKVYVAYGQYDEAERVLRSALSEQRGREDVQVTLLEILAEQRDTEGFNKIAGDMHRRTGGRGENWKRVAAMGYALDPSHPLYPPTADAAKAAEVIEVVEVPAAKEAATGTGTLANTQELILQQGGEAGDFDEAKTMKLSRTGLDAVTTPTARPASEFMIEFPAESQPSQMESAEKVQLSDDNALDFKIDLPDISPDIAPVPASAKVEQEHADLEFKLEVVDLPKAVPAIETSMPPSQPEIAPELPRIEMPAPPAVPDAPKDEHWEDVQQKFDLVRAFHEMGDMDGVREVLGEIEREGDAHQQTEARKMLASL